MTPPLCPYFVGGEFEGLSDALQKLAVSEGELVLVGVHQSHLSLQVPHHVLPGKTAFTVILYVQTSMLRT